MDGVRLAGFLIIPTSIFTITTKRILMPAESMNGRDMLLVLAHLFRMRGSPISVVEAVDFLSFKCRYGTPTAVRKMLACAVKNGMVSLKDDNILAQFLYHQQFLPLNLLCVLEDKVHFKEDIEPIH
jgi:hypothetical protein